MSVTAPTSKRPRRPTISDVAALAGVSRGTVSRVINGGHWVSPDALGRVNAAIHQVGYSANQHARSLVTGRAGSIGFLLTEPLHLLFEDPNFATMLRGATQALSDRNTPLLLMVASTLQERRQIATYIDGGHVDGVLLISTHAGDPLTRSLVERHVPAVFRGKPLGLEAASAYVAVEDRGSARTMTRYLLDKGYERIATIAGPVDMWDGVERVVGYKEALGAQADDRLIASGDYSRASGEAAMRDLLDRDVEPDAVFAASDLMAAGAITVIRERGLRVPEDIAVAGFDDISLAATLDPPLTTMRQPFERLAAEMVRVLFDILDGQEPSAVLLPTTLIKRASA